MKYYISDLHFCDSGIIKTCNRPVKDVDEMDKTLIDAWNCRVTDQDDVFVVGDFICDNKENFCSYLRRLHGHKYLIFGEHDTGLLKDPEALNMLENVMPYLELRDGEFMIILNYYPLAEWPGYHHGWKHFYGHIHNHPSRVADFMKESGNAFNVSADVIGPMPLTADEIITNRTNEWLE